MDCKEKLIVAWKKLGTKQLAKIFKEYMESINANKYNFKGKEKENSYSVDWKSTGWNRVQCFYHKYSVKYGNENILLVLRKKAGDYFIIERQSERAFEVDYSGIRNYDEKLLNEIMQDHKTLFDKLFEVTNETKNN